MGWWWRGPISPPQLELEAIGPSISFTDSHPISHWRLYVDNQEVTSFRRTIASKNIEQTTDFKFNFEIGNGNDIANGKFATWDTPKEIKLMAREYGGNNEVKLFQTYNFDGSVSSQLVKPSLEIEAIGPFLINYQIMDQLVNSQNEVTADVNLAKERITALEKRIEQDIVNIFKGNENNNNITDNIGFWNPLMEMGLGENQNYARGFYKYTEDPNQLSWNKLVKGNWSEISISAFENSSIFYNYAGIFMCYGIKKVFNRPIIDGVTDGSFNTVIGFDFMDEELSISWCPQMTFLSYTGETLEDNIINSGPSFPEGKRWEDDLFINTSNNVLYRYDINTDNWKAIGITPELDNLELKINTNETEILSLKDSVQIVLGNNLEIPIITERLTTVENDILNVSRISGDIQLLESNHNIIRQEINEAKESSSQNNQSLIVTNNRVDTHDIQLNQINIRNDTIENEQTLTNGEIEILESRLDVTDISWATLNSNDVILDINLELNNLDLSLNTLRLDHTFLEDRVINIQNHPNIQPNSLLLSDVDLSLNSIVAKLLLVDLAFEERDNRITDISSSLNLKFNQLSSSVGTFETTITDNSTKIAGLIGDIDDIILDIDDIKQDSNGIKQEMTTINVDVFNLQNKTDDLTTDISQNIDDIFYLQNKIDDLTKDISKNILDIESLDNSFNLLKDIPTKISNIELLNNQQQVINTDFEDDLQTLEGKIIDISARLLDVTHYHSGDFIIDTSDNNINKIYIPNTANLFYIDTNNTELDASNNPHQGQKLYIINASDTNTSGFIVEPGKTGYFIYTGENDLPNGVNAPFGWIRVFQADT